MKSVYFVLVQCLLFSVNISLCSERKCEVESEVCELENGADKGECKVFSQCENRLNTTYYPEGSNELVCCKHIRKTRGENWRSHTYVHSHPRRHGYAHHNHMRNNYFSEGYPSHNPMSNYFSEGYPSHNHMRNNYFSEGHPSHNHMINNHFSEGYPYHNHNLHNQRANQNTLDVIVPIVGGRDAERGEFPFMAALGFPDSGSFNFRCGGFFVAPNRVVTAGHCARFRGVAPTVVLPGGSNLNSGEPTIPITDIIQHPSYRARQTYNDIAILKLSGNSPYPSARLWNTEINFPIAIAVGYGQTEFEGNNSNVLKRVALSLFSNSFCSQFYPPARSLEQGLIDSQLCAGEIDNPVDTCQGDSGGPLIVNVNSNGERVPYVIGITSFGTGCAGGIPSIYTRIAPYVSWIESI